MLTKQTSLSAYFTTSSSSGSSLQDTSTSQPNTETSLSYKGSGEDQESSDTHLLPAAKRHCPHTKTSVDREHQRKSGVDPARKRDFKWLEVVYQDERVG